MNILVFGGSGFIGRYIVQELLSADNRVLNFDYGRAFDPGVCCGEYNYFPGSILDEDILSIVIDKFSPDIVINLAALASIEMCSRDPLLAFSTNVVGNLKILQYLKNAKFIYASSLYAQSNKSGSYGLTKKHSEDWVKYYSKKLGFPYVILRFGTVYGAGAGEDNSIRLLIERALKTKVLSYYGAGDEVRNYIHVRDIARYVGEIIFTERYDNKVLNLVGHQSMKSKDLLMLLKDLLGDGYEVEFRNEGNPNHYVVTPYDYQKDDSYVYVGDRYIDLGSGLLEVIKELDK